MKIVLSAALLVSTLVCAGNIAAAESFEEALRSKTIEFEAVGDGKYDAKMKLKLKNRKKTKAKIELEAGRFFYPDDKTIQPFVVYRPALISMDPEEEKTVWVFARCGNSGLGGNYLATGFRRTQMGMPELVSILGLMNDLEVSSPQLYQQVIWHYTNNHKVSAIHCLATSKDTQREIIHAICSRKGMRIPWYRTYYKPAENGNDMEFSGIPDRIEADVELVLSKTSDLQIQLVDAEGKSVMFVGSLLMQPAGVRKVPIRIDAATLAAGKYTIKVLDQNGSMIDSREIEV